MSFASRIDAVDAEQLRRVGSLKWTMFPGKIGAFVAESDLGVAPAIATALHEAVDRGILGYLPPALARDMSAATAEWILNRYDWSMDPADVFAIPDVVTGLQLALTHFCRPGTPVIVPTPAYMPFLTVPPALGHQVIQVPMLGGVLDLDGIEAAFRAGANLLLLCNPYNPVGRVFTREELEAVSAIVERHGGRVFADEIHAPVVFAPHLHVPYASIGEQAAAHTVTATSASKAWNLPGLKAAQFILSNDADRKLWETVGTMASHGASNLGVIANTAAYREGGAWLDEAVAYLDGNRRLLGELLAEHIPETGYRAPEGSYIGWLDARALGLDEAPADFFRERADVAMTDGIATGEAGRGFMRFIFATPRPIIERAVEQMAAALASR